MITYFVFFSLILKNKKLYLFLVNQAIELLTKKIKL